MKRAPNLDASAPAPILGFMDTVSLVVNLALGASILHFAGVIFANTPTGPNSINPWSALAVWAVGGALILSGILCLAELAASYPGAGGDYLYLSKAFGPWAGFLFGWAQFVVIMPALVGNLALVFGHYAAGFFDPHWRETLGFSSAVLYAFLAIVIVSVINLFNVTVAKWPLHFFALVKLLGLGALILAGFWLKKSPPGQWQATARPSELQWSPLALVLVLYAFASWRNLPFIAAEVREPAHNVPRAAMLGVGIVVVLSLLVNAAYLVGLGLDDAKRAINVPATLLDSFFNSPPALDGRMTWGERVVSLLAMVTALGLIHGLTLTSSRVTATLGNDYGLFRWLGRRQPGMGAPALAVVFQGLMIVGWLYLLGSERGQGFLTGALSRHREWFGLASHLPISSDTRWLAGDAFEALVNHASPLIWLFLSMTALALFRLRAADQQVERPFSVLLFPVVPIVFFNLCATMLYLSINYVGWTSLVGFGIVLAGLPIYGLARLVGYREEGDG